LNGLLHRDEILAGKCHLHLHDLRLATYAPGGKPCKFQSSFQRPPLAGLVLPGGLNLAREASLVDLAAGLAAGAVGVGAATGGRAAAGRGVDEEPPSKASDRSMAPLTSPRGPALTALEAGAACVGSEFARSCILLSQDGTKM
jgi:hypothetical protein